MTAITIELPDDVAHRLEAEAQSMNISVPQLLAFKAEQPLTKQLPDVSSTASKEQLMLSIIKDNAELYRRLA